MFFYEYKKLIMHMEKLDKNIKLNHSYKNMNQLTSSLTHEFFSSTSSIKTKYIKSLRLNNSYYIPKSKKKLEIEKNIHNRFIKLYSKNRDYYNVKIINEILSNQHSHIVAEFKDFLLKDELSEFFWKFYSYKESINLLKQIFKYYKITSVVFPNYILLTENKYLYKNIQKKQKLIDILEEKEEDILKHKKIMPYDTDEYLDFPGKIFNSKIFDSLLNESNSSQIKKYLFGVSTENSNLTDNENELKINNLVNNINKVEEYHYKDFLSKKILKKGNNTIKKTISEDKNKNNVKNEYSKIKMDKKNNNNGKNCKKINQKFTISRNRHKSLNISKFTKENDSLLKTISKYKYKAKTTLKNRNIIFQKLINNVKNKKTKNPIYNNNSFENNKNIIFNNIYKTDLYLNINNNIIIKDSKNKLSFKTYNNNKTKVDINKLKNLGISFNEENKYLKKNNINNLLLSINNNTSNKEIFKNFKIIENLPEYNYKKIKTEREADLSYNKNTKISTNKNIINNNSRSVNSNNNNSKRLTSINIEIMNNNKIKINCFKKSLNNLMSNIQKKKFNKNMNDNQNLINNNNNKYSLIYSSINNKNRKKHIESYYDSINVKNNSVKLKNNKYKNNNEYTNAYINSLTYRSHLSNQSKIFSNSKSKIMKLKNNNNEEIFSLTSRDMIKNEKNNINIKSKFLNISNNNYILFNRPKSLNKSNINNRNNTYLNKINTTKISKTNNKNENLSLSNIKINKKILKKNINTTLEKRFEILNKNIIYKRNIDNSIYQISKKTSLINSSLSININNFNRMNLNNNKNINKNNTLLLKTQKLNKNENKKNKKINNANDNNKRNIRSILDIKDTCQIKNKNSFINAKNINEIKYYDIEMKNKNYKNNKGFEAIFLNKNNRPFDSYTDRTNNQIKIRTKSYVNKI